MGLRTSFPVDALVDFLLDDAHAGRWLGAGGHLDDHEPGTLFVPEVSPGVQASIQDVTRNRSSFRLVANWDDGVGQLIVRVTTCPGGRSRVRVRETGLAPEVVPERLRAWSRVFARLEVLLRDASRERRTFRQAIVVVHGIGEQRPTTTLRNFVEAVFPEARGTRRFLKPDYVSPTRGRELGHRAGSVDARPPDHRRLRALLGPPDQRHHGRAGVRLGVPAAAYAEAQRHPEALAARAHAADPRRAGARRAGRDRGPAAARGRLARVARHDGRDPGRACPPSSPRSRGRSSRPSAPRCST